VVLNIEDYALIGDCETAALVGKDGSIDWLCWPDFSSPACFAALVGKKENGRWLIAPREGAKKVTRRYLDHTLILETEFETASGVMLLTDFMPIRERHSDVVRIVRCRRGRISVKMELCARFDYGRTIPWTGPHERNCWAAAAGTGVVYLRTRTVLRTVDSTAIAEFALQEGEHRSFVLTHVRAEEPPPRQINVRKALAETKDFWIRWCGINTYEGSWRGEIERSLITLKALTYRPSGGIVAAATTSLPERIGVDRNWDYRYCWLRDAAFTLESLLSVGYHEEARAWQQWLLQSVGGDVSGMQIMYGMCGERHLPECELPWLPGYKGSGPVRIGNGASEQLQLDAYGEVADAITSMGRAKLSLDERLHLLQQQLTEHVSRIYHQPASGIWERRDHRDHFTYSKMMVWLALNHGIETNAGRSVRIWRQKRDRLHHQICSRGFNRNMGSFVQTFGSGILDASTLLLPIFGFLPFDDDRVRGTVEATQKSLIRNGLVYRYLPTKKNDKEAAFLACSFWLVQNLAGMGRRAEAERLFEKLLILRNDVGLLSEEYEPESSQFRGNFPQALSHIALINAGRALSAL
jgi:GH15 family glucan-1,4-alpha-glucosidase